MYQIREIIQMTPAAVLGLPQPIEIMFEDGVSVTMSSRKCVYSHYFWELHRQYPLTPAVSAHCVDAVLKGQPLSMDTHIRLLQVIYHAVVKAYDLHLPVSKEPLLRLLYQITNAVSNEIPKLAEAYVTSIDILDFIEVIDHPVIAAAIGSTDPRPESIAETYRVVVQALNTDVTLSRNPLVTAVRAGLVNINQVLQCVAIRGFVSEVDGSILSTPVMSNYAKGMNDLYEYAADSRSAARALYFSEAPLQDAEYFARRLQLLSMSVESIDYIDCGSTRYMSWRVQGPRVDDHGHPTYAGDLKFMLGKYYLDPAGSGTLLEITHDDPALYDQVLQIRTVLYCQHPDPHRVCEICFGALAHNVTRFANLGHLCSATMTQQTSQSVLSTKHLLTSAVSANIQLTETARTYFTTNKAKNAYVMRRDMRHADLSLVVNRQTVPGLIDILNIDDLKNINPIRVSSIDFIEVLHRTATEERLVPIEVADGKRQAVFTEDFLKYLKEHGWETDIRNNFVFDLAKWDFALPVMKLPDMEYSYSDHSQQIAKVIESNMKEVLKRSAPDSPISTLQELFALVNSKLNVNISALEVIIYATMVPSGSDFGLARNVPDPILGISDQVIKNRSLGAAYAYEDITTLVTSPRSFFPEHRGNNLFDVFLAPNETVQDYRGRDKD